MKEFIINILSKISYSNYIENLYLQSALILISFLILAYLVIFIFKKYLEQFALKTKNKIDDMLVDHTKKPLFYLILAYGIKIALLNLNVNGSITNLVESVMAIVFLFILLRVIDIFIEIWSNTFAKKTKTTFDDVLLPLLHKISKVVFVIIALLWVLKIWNINITPYLAGVGISGLILGMALQDSLKNIFGGISLITDRNFHVGDAIMLDSGELGVIQEVGLRSTKLLTYDHELFFVPNGLLANMKIKNFVRPNNRVRKIVEFSVAYGSKPDKVKKVVLETLKKIESIYDEPYMDVIMIEMADSGIKFKARFWVDWENAYSKFVEATEKIYQALGKEKIEIPFPTRTIYLKK
ncbi:MAG: mechanosensitive ion channel family protein [Candidatus Woesearchaeota archaeon]